MDYIDVYIFLKMHLPPPKSLNVITANSMYSPLSIKEWSWEYTLNEMHTCTHTPVFHLGNYKKDNRSHGCNLTNQRVILVRKADKQMYGGSFLFFFNVFRHVIVQKDKKLISLTLLPVPSTGWKSLPQKYTVSSSHPDFCLPTRNTDQAPGQAEEQMG